MIIVVERYYLNLTFTCNPVPAIQALSALMRAGAANPFYIHQSSENEGELALQYHWASREAYSEFAHLESIVDFCWRFCSSPPRVAVYDCYGLSEEHKCARSFC